MKDRKSTIQPLQGPIQQFVDARMPIPPIPHWDAELRGDHAGQEQPKHPVEPSGLPERHDKSDPHDAHTAKREHPRNRRVSPDFRGIQNVTH
jgi:hypothetical protein